MRIRNRLEKLEKKIQPLIQNESNKYWSEFLTRLTLNQLNTLHDLMDEGKNDETIAFIKEIEKEWQAAL